MIKKAQDEMKPNMLHKKQGMAIGRLRRDIEEKWE